MPIRHLSTPANYFHVLRRQQLREFRKPLVVFFSKNLLRHPLARSSLEDMSGESIFERYIPEAADDKLVEPEKIRRHILCSGESTTSKVSRVNDDSGLE